MSRKKRQKSPWMKFYPSDWRADPALRSCSIAARGLWIEMLAIMHEAEPRGHLLVHGRSPTDTQLAVLAGISPDQLPDLLGELEAAGVFSRTSKGVIYSRRMTRDTKSSKTARKNGQKGGNPALKTASTTTGKHKEKSVSDNPPDKPPDNAEDKTQKPEARGQSSSRRRRRSERAREDADPGSSVSQPIASPDADELYDRVLAAAGHASGRQLPTWWMPPAATLHVQRWRDLGLSDDEIVEVVRQAQAHFTEPAQGPKAFDRAMAAYAAEKAEPAITPTVQHLNGGKPQPPPQGKPDIFQAVIEKARRGEL